MEKIYRVQMNSKGMPNFATAVEIDTDISGYSDRLWKNAYERGKADRPQGEWIRDRYWSRGVGMGEEYGFFYKCSMCEHEVEGGYTRCGFNYCPYCGTDMKGVDDEID